MTESVAIKAILAHDVEVGKSVTVKGWVRSRRTSKGGFAFIHIHDGSCFDTIQAVADEALHNYETINQLGAGCSVVVQGELVESAGRGQDREIQAQHVEVIGLVDDPETYPISKKQHTYEFLRGVAHLRPRTNTFGAMARIRHTVANAVHNYFNQHGFFWVNTPIITASDCEGAGELFRVSTLDQVNRPEDQNYADDFFGTETFLTVSGQLNVES
ncbi:MAG: OB-fold nucleic acid binding domain-containing protein, partial [Pseudomonadota bacterium]|nr:OB-fold nucleic acid binding domain-containing protein [Pseudomonadota bacterium]